MTTKAVFLSPHFICVLALLTCVILTGCESSSGEESPEEDTVPGEFGDPYQIVTNFHPADPDFMPQLMEDTLVAQVTYSGGCETHEFGLTQEVERDTAKLWIHHDAGGDNCEALIQDEVRLPVSDDVQQAPVIVLLNPRGGPPFMVRWGK